MTAVFSRENKPHKAQVQEMVVNRIYYQLNPRERAYGIHVFTLAGDDVPKCFGISKKLLGKNGKMYSAENNGKTFLKQLVQHRDMGRPSSLKIKEEEFTTLVHGNLQRTRTPTLFIDFDACCWLDTLIRRDLDNIWDIAHKCSRHQKTVWFSVTFSRGYKDNEDEEEQLGILQDAWTHQGWKCESFEVSHYRDGMPMGVALWKFASAAT